MEPTRFVYILRSDTNPDRHYVGLTSDLTRRLHWHNNGPSGVTVYHRPWSLVVSLEFANAKNAARLSATSRPGPVARSPRDTSGCAPRGDPRGVNAH